MPLYVFIITIGATENIEKTMINKDITPFEVIREEIFSALQEDDYNTFKDANKVIHTRVNQTIIKSKSIIHSHIGYGKRLYNEKSKLNLVQNQSNAFKELNRSRKVELLENELSVSEWTENYIKQYETEKKKKFNWLPSKQTTEKVYRISSVFVRSILSGFVPNGGFKQRSISFCTFTLTEPQKHSDQKIIETFVDFIDHLKKVKNYLIDPITKERTKDEGLKIENYLWRAETQENGNIHFHLISDVFLNQDMLRRTWNNYLQNLGYQYGYGASNVNSLRKDKKNNKIGNVEQYICKYMTKPPLRKAYKNFTKRQLLEVPDFEKYRRPILGKTWGSSKKLLKLEYPKFYGAKATKVFNTLKKNLKEYTNINIPDYIKIFCGDIRKEFKKQTYQLQRELKNHYLMCLQWLYDEIPLTI